MWGSFDKIYSQVSKLQRKFCGNLEEYYKILMKYLEKFEENSKQLKEKIV